MHMFQIKKGCTEGYIKQEDIMKYNVEGDEQKDLTS